MDESGTSSRVLVVLVDDHRLFRTGVRTGVRTGLGEAVDVAGEAETVGVPVALVHRTAPRSCDWT